MLCYLDRTFCNNPNCTCDSSRKLTDEVREAAKKWWGSDDAPICVANLCGGKPYVQEQSLHTAG